MDLELALADLGRHVVTPTADLSGVVAERLRESPREVVALSRPDRVRWVAVAAVLAVTAVMSVLPSPRRAIADLFGVDGISIEVREKLPSLDPQANELNLGDLVGAAEIASLVDFELAYPSRLGPPDEIYLRDDLVTFSYRPSDHLPRTAIEGVGALFSQFRGSFEPNVQKQTPEVRPVVVDGSEGYFIPVEHVVYLVDAEGRPRTDTQRLAGKVLLWQEGGITYRLEAQLGLEALLSLAEDLAGL
jgi:hypothetical protein